MIFSRNITLGLVMITSSSLFAGPADEAKRMYDRITGVQPSIEVLNQMTELVAADKPEEAARIAVESEDFLAYNLRNLVARWANVDEQMDFPFNDYTATAVGLIRDNEDFGKILYDDVIYTANAASGIAAYNGAGNDHYVAIEQAILNQGSFSLKTQLEKRVQSATNGLPVAATAGGMTTRGWGQAYYSAGTNRRAFRFMSMTYMCRDLEQLTDNTRNDVYVRRDVDRAPGGDPKVYRDKCAGCHAGMDPLSAAFNRYDLDNNDDRVTYDPNGVAPKTNLNKDVFPAGMAQSNDDWINLWTVGPNKAIGWPAGSKQGSGLKALGQVIAQTDAFNQCMATKVYRNVCFQSTAGKDRVRINDLAKTFAQDHNMKTLFVNAAVKCKSD